MVSYEVSVGFRKVVFMLHAIDIDDMGFQAKEDLATTKALKDTPDIGEQRICRNDLIKSVSVQVWDPGLDMPSHRIPDDHFSQLSSLSQGALMISTGQKPK